MRGIPAKLRKLLENMPRMKICEARYRDQGACVGRIQWHHVWEYAGRQINEHWAILGACEYHHFRVKTSRHVKELFERRSLEIATKIELAKYPKKCWNQIKAYLK